MTRVLAIGLCLFASAGYAASLAERADAIVLDMLGAVSAVSDYEARLVVQTTLNGQLQQPKGLLIRQRRMPNCIYTKWLSQVDHASERLFCGDDEIYHRPVRKSAKTLVNRRGLSAPQIKALAVVLSPVDEDGIYGMVARYANVYFDAAENASSDDFSVGLRQATVFKRPASCLRIRRNEPIAGAPFQGQSEVCIDDRSKLPSSFRQWNAEGELQESYLMGDYQINRDMGDEYFQITGR